MCTIQDRVPPGDAVSSSTRTCRKRGQFAGVETQTITTHALAGDTGRQHTTLLLVFVTIIGLFIDVWSHGQHFIETFFSVWHLPLYAGYLATACWILAPIVRAARNTMVLAGLSRTWWCDAAGVAIFGVGGAADAVWHSIYGLETGVDVLFSPSHFLLFIGLILMASSPFRAAWADGSAGDAWVSLRAFLAPLLSLALTTSLVGVVMIHLWGFTSSHFMTRSATQLVKELGLSTAAEGLVRDLVYARAIGNILITNAVLLTPILLMLQRWRVPFGSLTICLALPTVLMAAVTGFFVPRLLAVPVIAGLVADAAAQILRPSPQRSAALRVFATVTPVILWSLYVAAIHWEWGLARSPLFWSGLVLWTGAEGLALSLLVGPAGAAAPEMATGSTAGSG